MALIISITIFPIYCIVLYYRFIPLLSTSRQIGNILTCIGNCLSPFASPPLTYLPIRPQHSLVRFHPARYTRSYMYRDSPYPLPAPQIKSKSICTKSADFFFSDPIKKKKKIKKPVCKQKTKYKILWLFGNINLIIYFMFTNRDEQTFVIPIGYTSVLLLMMVMGL